MNAKTHAYVPTAQEAAAMAFDLNALLLWIDQARGLCAAASELASNNDAAAHHFQGAIGYAAMDDWSAVCEGKGLGVLLSNQRELLAHAAQ